MHTNISHVTHEPQNVDNKDARTYRRLKWNKYERVKLPRSDLEIFLGSDIAFTNMYFD